MAGATFVGIVRSFNPHKGWGFIECDATKQQHGSDVFLLKDELNGFAVGKGDQVSFNVATGDKGIRATNVKVVSASPDGLQSFFGEVKSFNPNKGFGFISGPASEAAFGKDCFVLRQDFVDGYAEQGMHVQFKATMGERGPVATEVRVLDRPGGSRLSMVPVYPPLFGDYGKGGKGFPFASFFGGKGGFFGGKGGGWYEPKESDVFFGTVKAINERGFGHVSSEAVTKIYGKDMFAHKTSVDEANVTAGQEVSFNVSSGPKGPHAVNIKPFNAPAGMVFTGTVKTFNDAKNFGFIESPAAAPIFHSDIFLHKSELGEKTVSAGDQVQFSVDTSSGRASAKNVR